MSYKIDEIANSIVTVGEGPHWDIPRQSLYYVNIRGANILRYSYNENKIYKAQLEGQEHVSFIIPVEGSTDQFAVGSGRRVLIVRWDGISEIVKVIKTAYEVEKDDKRCIDNALNDGKCDSHGRLFAGTLCNVVNVFEKRVGSFYKFEKGSEIELLKSDVSVSNGLAFNDTTKKFYFVDTCDYEVKEYDYDVASGNMDLSKPRIAFDFRRNDPSDHLLPDGATIDTEGNIYVATFNDHTVYKINPSTSKILLKIKLPCLHITSVAFGGPNLDILYVTTSNLDDQPAPAGALFKVTGLGVKGVPMNNIKI